MDFKDYLEQLIKLRAEHPEIDNYLVVASIDDEGNGFNPICCDPYIGHYDSEDKDFYAIADLDDEDAATKNANAVCIN